jgi:hypothetical protein
MTFISCIQQIPFQILSLSFSILFDVKSNGYVTVWRVLVFIERVDETLQCHYRNYTFKMRMYQCLSGIPRCLIAVVNSEASSSV